MAIPELEPNSTHLVYLVLSFFLILYALFSEFIRNRCHLSEPPLATVTGIAFGPVAVDVLGKVKWRFQDNITQEMARVITGVQVFTVGIELPPGYVKRHWKSLALLLAPNMAFGWCASAAILKFILGLQWSSAFICAACLTPTDPVLSASVLGEANFSTRIPRRIRYLLSAESGCNDGSAFPFLYAVVFAVTQSSKADWSKMFFIETVLWQCVVGCIVGIIIGIIANRALRYSVSHNYTQESTLFVFYFLLAIFSVGVASVLGLDDFLVAFSSGTAFCWDGWFREKTHQMKLPSIIDLLLNSTMFVYFGTIIPWEQSSTIFGVGKLIGCAVLILLLRRIPAFLALKRFMPELRTWREAIFAGHFGPMGVGAMFLAMEARGRLEGGSSTPLPHPPHSGHPHQEAISAVWPVISIVVLGSIMVHGLSAIVMSLYGHFARPTLRRASVPGGEQERLSGFANEDGTFTDDEAVKSDNEDDEGLESTDEEEAVQGNGAIRVG